MDVATPVVASNWWHDVNESPLWQDRIFHVLAALYGLVAAVALVLIQPPAFYIIIRFFLRFKIS